MNRAMYVYICVYIMNIHVIRFDLLEALEIHIVEQFDLIQFSPLIKKTSKKKLYFPLAVFF